MSEGTQINEPAGEVVVYEAPDGGARVEVVVGDDTVWLTQGQMVDLFGRGQSVIARHIGNVFAEGELPRDGSMQILHRTPDGGRLATFYNLDVVISVGYRVKSRRGTQFRIWANGVRIERAADVKMSTIRRLARSANAELDLTAVLPDGKRIPLLVPAVAVTATQKSRKGG